MVIIIAVMLTVLITLFVITTALMAKDYELKNKDEEENKDGTDAE